MAFKLISFLGVAFDTELDDGGERRRGGKARRDAQDLPRLQGSAQDHRRRVDGHGVDARAAARQERRMAQVGTRQCHVIY